MNAFLILKPILAHVLEKEGSVDEMEAKKIENWVGVLSKEFLAGKGWKKKVKEIVDNDDFKEIINLD